VAKGKKQEDPNKVAQRKQARVEFVQANPNLAPEVARQRFYVQTRANELEAAGKPVDRAALREKFQTGGVTREGFYTPGDVSRFNASSNGSSLADSKSTVTPPVVPSTPVAPAATPTPVTGGGKMPPSSYQAPQVTTSLGQVAQPSTSYMGPQARTPNPVRGGEPGRGVTPPKLVRPGMPAGGGEPDRKMPRVAQNGMSVGPATTDPAEGREFSATVGRVFPQAPANPKALRQQAQARFERVEVPKIKAEMIKNIPLRRGEQERIDAGYVPAPYDWTNLYKFGSGAVTLGAEILGSRGGPVGAALAAGIAFNTTERLGNLLEQKGAFGGMPGDPGRYEGKTDFKSAAVVAGAALTGDVLGKGIQKIAPIVASKIPGIKSSVTDWASGAVAREGMSPIQQRAQRAQSIAAKGTKGKAPIEMPGRIPFVSESKGPLAIGPAGDASATRPLYGPPSPVKTPAVAVPKSTETVVRDSGLVIPGTTQRTPAAERSPVLQKALDDVLGKPSMQDPVSLGDSKANTVAQQLKEDGVAELTPRQVAARKGAATRKANREKSLEIKQPETIGAAKPEPIPSPEPAPAPTKGLSVVEGNPRADMMRGHPSFKGNAEPPALSVVGDEPVKATTKNPPRQRPNETAEAYGKRLDRWQLENSGSVFKAPAGFEQPRGTTSFREGAMERIQGGMSRTRRSVAFIDDGSGMSPEGYPVQMQGESFMAFNKRSAEFSKSRGIKLPETPDNSFLAQGTPEPVSLGQSKATAAAGEIPAKPKGLGRNAFYDAEKGEWVAGVLDKKSGKIVAKGERTVYATEEDRIAGQKAYEAQRNADRRAKRAANKTVKETELKAAVTPVSSNAELGPFMFGGEPVGRSRVVLEPGKVPDWAQQNISLTGEAKPLSAVEDAWLNKDLTPEENAFFRELGNAKKTSAGKRVVRSTRQPTPEEVKEYVSRFRGLRAERTEKGLSPGATPVALTNTQIQLEKEIEQVLGTDAMIALRNTAIRGNSPALTQNVRGLESLAEIKATSGEPLIDKLVVRQATPASSGKLREQAANFFNAEGRLKGVSGADRARTWNRLTKSDWFRQLQEREPSFANFLRERNSDIAGKFDPMLSRQVEQLPKPGFRQAKPMRGMGMEEEERFIAGQLANEQTDDGLGAYKIAYGETPQEGLRALDSGTTVSQRSQAAQIEAASMRRERLLRQIRAEDQTAFGDIDAYNRGFEEGQVLDDMVDKGITSDYGITDERGFANIDYSQFNLGRRQLNQPFQAGVNENTVLQAQTDAIQIERRAVQADKKAGVITKEEAKAKFADIEQRLSAIREAVYDAPLPTQLSNPFQQDFGTQLPKDYVREIPESFGKVWDPDTWTNELGTKVNGRWVTRQEAAEKAQSRIDKQAARTSKMELERENFYSDRWLNVAKRASLASKSSKPEPTPMFDRFGPVRSEASIREEAQRLASLDRKAARAKAAAPRGRTAEEIRFELKNPLFGPEVPKGFTSQTREESLSNMYREEMLAQKDVAEEMFSDYDMSDWVRDVFD